MQKPQNYDETQAMGDFTPVELGGHYLVIKQVTEAKSKTGKDMIVVFFDFDQKDKQPGYFTEQFKNDIRPDKKWPNQATQRVLTEDDMGRTSRQFKTFCSCVEHSNTGFKVQWGDNWGAQFKGKKIGGVFGIVENKYEDKVTKRRELRWFVSADKVDDAAIPEEKLLPQELRSFSASIGTDFVNVPDAIDEELPFN